MAALRLQIEWGADEAIEPAPIDRTRPPPPNARRQPPQAPAQTIATATGNQAAAVTAKLPAAVARAHALAAAAPDRDALRHALTGFTDCPLAATAGKLVFSDGNPAARLVLVGDVPGAEEDVTGLPFTGPAGKLLDRMLASIGLTRELALLTTLIPWRPPGNRPPTEAEMAMCLPFLLRHLTLLQPRLVVSLGALPTRALTNNNLGIRRLRGRWTEIDVEGLSWPVPVLPMFTPASLIANPADKRDAWADLLALRERLSQNCE